MENYYIPNAEFDYGYINMDWNTALQKGLSATYNVDPSSMLDTDALKRESLQTELVMATHQEDSAAFFKACPKIKATSNVEQYTVVTDVGEAQFYSAGGLPDITSDSLKREFELVKYMGVVGQVDGPTEAMSGSLLKDAVATETMLKMLELVRSLDKQIFRADASVNPAEWNGIWKQHKTKCKLPNQSIIDLRGKYITPEIINQATEVIAQVGFGVGGEFQCWMGTEAMRHMIDGLLAQKRFLVNGQDLRQNTFLETFANAQTKNGKYKIDVFLNPDTSANGGLRLNPSHNGIVSTSAKAPNTPTAINVNVTTPTNDTVFTLDAGAYEYAILLVNKFGKSAAYETTPVNVASGRKVVFTVTEPNPVSGQEATGVEIWRRASSSNDVRDYRFMDKFPIASLAIQDTGEWIPGTSTITMFHWDPVQVFAFYQLLNITRDPLGKIADAIRWLQKIYATPIVKNANKIVVVRNVGSLLWE